MANFDIAFQRVLIKEGVYGNDPNDKGGETCFGITRKSHPNEEMWKIVDDYKAKYGNNINTLRAYLKKDTTILNNVRRIYKTSYWNRFQLDKVKNNAIACEVFDDAVNRGVAGAAKLLKSIFGLPVNGSVTKDLLDKLQEL